MSLELSIRLVAAAAVAYLFAASVCAAAYQNPLELSAEEAGAGIADPGLMRWMGKYYLYATKVVEDPGIRCWESADLVNWTFRGFCTGEDPAFGDRMAWSPGPFYYDGRFYLYVCSSDQKHRVFAADRPEGPFECVNDDLLDVRTLDAAPFLDDDGQLYLFYAGWGGDGIQYRTCSSPVTADGENRKLGQCQFSVQPDNYWVEGPALIKVNGVYYLTYCGNDWKQDNYQVRAAVGRTIPDLQPQQTNPIISQTTGEWVATGCNWMVMGPDLKSIWNVYHCRKKGGAARRLCLDAMRIDAATNELICDGPTWEPTPNPALPAWQEAFNKPELGADWSIDIGEWETGEGFVTCTAERGQEAELTCRRTMAPGAVAEFNLRLVSDSKERREPAYGVVLADSDQPLAVIVNSRSKTLELARVGSDGHRRMLQAAPLPQQFDMDAWHTLLLDRRDGRLRVYFDSMLKLDVGLSSAEVVFSLVAERCSAAFGWCGVSDIGAE